MEHGFVDESVFALGIVGWEIDEGTFFCEAYDFVWGLVGDGFVGAYSVDFSCEEELLVVAGVAGEEEWWGAKDDYRYVMWGVAGGGNDEYVAASCERHGLLEWAEGLIFEVDEFGLPPLWPAVREVALEFASKAACSAEFLLGDPDFAVGEVGQSAGVIGVEMG
jgi:hypothetical protein